MKGVINIDGLILYLNSLLEYDREAISDLVLYRSVCNKYLLEHPTVQCGLLPGNTGEVGLLGILNGLFGVFDYGPKEGWGPIQAVLDDDGQIIRFERVKNVECEKCGNEKVFCSCRIEEAIKKFNEQLNR